MSTFYSPNMQQYYASIGYDPMAQQAGNQNYASGMQSGGGPQGGYQPGSRNSMVGSGAMNPYMLDTFGHGQYYQPYGLPYMAQQQQVPQQPYYHVPTEYIPEGTPGLQRPQAQAQAKVTSSLPRNDEFYKADVFGTDTPTYGTGLKRVNTDNRDGGAWYKRNADGSHEIDYYYIGTGEGA
jgi:hypothetical protein